MLNRIFLKIPANISLKCSPQFSQVSRDYNKKQKQYSGIFSVTIICSLLSSNINFCQIFSPFDGKILSIVGRKFFKTTLNESLSFS